MREFFLNHQGELAALFTACLWTVSAFAFEAGSKRIGSLAVNIYRLVIALVFLCVLNVITRGRILPADASGFNWLWLSLSGLIGFTVGDLFLFKSYTIIGSRFSMLIMTLVPPVTTLFSWLMIGERLKPIHFAGMSLTFIGIAIAIFNKKDGDEKYSLKLAPSGVLYALGGAVGQALGMVLSKIGITDYNPFAATQIRIIAGLAGFILLITALSRWGSVIRAAGNTGGMKATTLGAFFGPFLGVSFSLISVRLTQAGIAATIMAITPVLIIPPAVFLYRQKVTFAEIAGSLISVAGVAVFFM